MLTVGSIRVVLLNLSMVRFSYWASSVTRVIFCRSLAILASREVDYFNGGSQLDLFTRVGSFSHLRYDA
jgi:hypothetical protein